MRSNRLLAGLIAAALVATSCGGGDTSEELRPEGLGGTANQKQLDALYAAAKKAGDKKLVIYSETLGGGSARPVLELFEKRYPAIDVQAQAGFGAQLASRLDHEFAANQHVGDLLEVAVTDLERHSAQGRIEAYSPPTATAVAKEFVCAEGHALGSELSVLGIGYNTQKVKADEAPKSWDDLLDPKWKGKIALNSPLQPGHGAQIVQYLLANGFTMDWVRKLAAQDPTLVPGTRALVDRLAQGQASIGVPAATDQFLAAKAKGAPIGMTLPTGGGNVKHLNCMGIIKGAPHEDAARLFYSWWYTPEVQKVIAKKMFKASVLPGAAPPEGMPPMDRFEFWPEIPPAEYTKQQSAIIKELNPIFR
ncbi:ABC transporter substrate-binding protein [Actinomadura chibensis]|uniref:Extracellular solute-binding protein n=1 Tax=Actinomadura chibensis TaxID=392828 RepID=A0A5D0NE19_9ACTN|nr:extracellular solute-binding protein [Actinomadura chibensis]TYB42455.1 extracellular solute-binding protein [Actinomadura chibensis]